MLLLGKLNSFDGSIPINMPFNTLVNILNLQDYFIPRGFS